MNIRLHFVAVIVSLGFIGNAWAQSITIPTTSVDKGDTGTVNLAFTAGGAATNLDFTISYDETVVDEASAAIDCSTTIPQLTALNCSVNTITNEFRGIGVNLTTTPLESTDPFAVLTLPVLPGANSGDSVQAFVANFFDAGGNSVGQQTDTWTLTVTDGPQPDWSSVPDSATGIDFGSHTTETGAYPLDLVVTNAGADGSTLTGECAVTGSTVFSIVGDNTLGTGLLMGASTAIQVQCDTTGAAVQLHTGTMTCTHNGDGTTEVSPTAYALNCNVTATPEPFYSDSLSPDPMDLVAVEEGDTNPLGTLQVLNVGGDANMNLTCSYSGDSQISMTLDGFPVLIGIDSLVEIQVGCDATTEGLYSGSISCAHDASNVASPVVYPATCDVGPPGDAVYESNPAAGSTIDLTPPGSPVLEGTTIPTQDLVITNNPPELNDRELNLLNCNLIGMSPISATPATTPLAPGASTTVTFSCDSTTAGDYSDTYACSYDVDGDSTEDGVANYTVNCGVREPESDVTQSPPAGSTLTIVVTPIGTGSRSIFFAESADEGEDGSLDNCVLADTTYFSIIEPTGFPAVIPSGTTIPVNVEATGTPDGEPASTTLTCTTTDSDGTDVLVWTLAVVTRIEPIPTLSEWGMSLMILTLLGLGGIVIRRRVVI